MTEPGNVDDLDAEIQELLATIHELNSSVEKLQNDNQGLIDHKNQTEKEFVSTTEELTRIKTIQNELIADKNRLQLELAATSAIRTTTQDLNVQLHVQIAAFEQKQVRAELEIESLTASLAEINTIYNTVCVERDALKKEVNTSHVLLAEKHEIEKKREIFKRTIRYMENKSLIRSWKRYLVEVKQIALKDVEAKKQAQAAEFDETEAGMRADTAHLLEQLSLESTRLEKTRQDLSQVKKDLSQLKKKHEETTVRAERVQKELLDHKNSSEHEVTQLKKHRDDLAARSDNLQTDLRAIHASFQATETELLEIDRKSVV